MSGSSGQRAMAEANPRSRPIPSRRLPVRTRAPAAAWPAVGIAGYAVAAVALFLCYLRISGTQAVTSDGASNALQAWDMLHGNWLLKGWMLTDVSFYTTELPEYMFLEVFRGLGPADVHTAAAFTYTLLVILAGLLAKGTKTGKEGLVRVLIASGIMIAPQVWQGSLLLLLSPDHTGTGVPLLLIFLVLDRAPRRPVGAGGRRSNAGLGRGRGPARADDRRAPDRRGLPPSAPTVTIVQRREPWQRALRSSSALAAAAIVSVGVSDAGGAGSSGISAGTSCAPLNTHPRAQRGSWPAHIALAAEGVLGLYGADFTHGSVDLGHRSDSPWSTWPAVALAAWAVGRARSGRFFTLR